MYRHVTTRLCGLVILIAGIWGGLIPFLGPVFHFTLGPDHAWRWTTGRLWLSVLPAAAAVLGGLILMGGGPRLSGRLGALIALAGGVWFAVGPDVSMLWNHGVSQAGVPHGTHTVTRMLEFLTLHSGIGVLITAFAAYALPGVAALGSGRRRVERDAAIAGTGAAVGAAEAHHRDRVAAREGAVGAGVGAGAGAGTAAARQPNDMAAAARQRNDMAAEEPVTTREPIAAPEGDGAANGTYAGEDGPANGGQTTTQRRGGFAGWFSRR